MTPSTWSWSPSARCRDPGSQRQQRRRWWRWCRSLPLRIRLLSDQLIVQSRCDHWADARPKGGEECFHFNGNKSAGLIYSWRVGLVVRKSILQSGGLWIKPLWSYLEIFWNCYFACLAEQFTTVSRELLGFLSNSGLVHCSLLGQADWFLSWTSPSPPEFGKVTIDWRALVHQIGMFRVLVWVCV